MPSDKPKTLQFAFSEFDKYWKMIDNEHTYELNINTDKSDNNKEDIIADDEFYIESNGLKINIEASSPRSALLAVYYYLYKAGCRFLSPGRDGEIIPKKDLSSFKLEIKKKSEYRHRGICIEGATSLENVLDLIDWMPKVGFNSYFIQFREGHTFFERWYTHEGNELLKADDYSIEKSRGFVKKIEEELEKRSMIYHKTGHGWTCECIGYPSTGWHKVENNQISDDIKPYLAMINGERKFFGDIPLNTHLCYSNSKARKLIVDEIVSYAEKNRNVDILHFWLADNFNNVCECDECKKHSLTDYYVQMLNDIDRRLTELNINIKIVFLIYFELLWPPVTEKINNPDRFIMMFAPITRTYSKPYITNEAKLSKDTGGIMHYQYNKMVFPSDINENLKMLFNWQKHFTGDSFAFEYHLMWDIYRDYGAMRLSRVLYSDIKSLKKLGLDGLMSCQLTRAFFPNSLCMYIMGRALFESDLEYDDIVNEYFSNAYGEDYRIALEFMNALSCYFPIEYLKNEAGGYISERYAVLFSEGYKYLKEKSCEIHKLYLKYLDTEYRKMWKNINYCCIIYSKVAVILQEKASGADKEKLLSMSKDFNNYINNIELELQGCLDAYYFKMILSGLFIDSEVKL